MDIPVRFHSYCLCMVQCDTWLLSQVPVNHLPLQRMALLVWKSLDIDTIVSWVAVISHQAFQNILLSSLFWLGAVPASQRFRRNASRSRCIIVCVQCRSGFGLSPDPTFVLCWGDCTFHLRLVPHIVN